MSERGPIPHNPLKWPSAQAVSRGESIHIWLADLDMPPDHLSRLEGHLSPVERTRAEGFRFARDRERFIAGRGSLREILAHYVGEPSSQLKIASHPHGKPFLPEHPDWHFNLSHSQNRALLAVAYGCEVGVDIEKVREDVNIAALTPRLFSAREKELLHKNKNAPYAIFFQLWTLKEAYLKGVGQGFRCPLSEVDVSSCLTEGHPRLWSTETHRWTSCEEWLLRSVSILPSYMAAVAQRSNLPVELHRF